MYFLSKNHKNWPKTGCGVASGAKDSSPAHGAGPDRPSAKDMQGDMGFPWRADLEVRRIAKG